MAAVPFFGGTVEESVAWDFCWLGTSFLPGIATVEVDDPGRDVDVQRAKGNVGATLSDSGTGAAKVTISLQLYDEVQWEAWLDVRKLIDPKNPGGLKTPLEIIHPATAVTGVQTVYVTRIHQAPPSGGLMRVTIEALQWFPAPKPNKTTQKKPAPGQHGGSKRRTGMPGEDIPLNAVEGLDGLNLGDSGTPGAEALETPTDRERRQQAAGDVFG